MNCVDRLNEQVAHAESLRVVRNKIELAEIFCREEFCAFVGITSAAYESYVAAIRTEFNELMQKTRDGKSVMTSRKEEMP